MIFFLLFFTRKVLHFHTTSTAPSNSIVSEDAGIEPRTVLTLALSVGLKIFYLGLIFCLLTFAVYLQVVTKLAGIETEELMYKSREEQVSYLTSQLGIPSFPCLSLVSWIGQILCLMYHCA